MDGRRDGVDAGTEGREAHVIVRRVHADTTTTLYHIEARVACPPGWTCSYKHGRGDISALSYRYIVDDAQWCITYYTLASSKPITYFEFWPRNQPAANCSLTLSLHENGALVAVGSGIHVYVKEKDFGEYNH